MVPAPSCPITWDYWSSPQTDSVELTCLLPNSMYIPLRKSLDATLEDVKEELWDKAVHYPLFGMLLEMNKYTFQFVNSLAVTEELEDERKRICDIKPVCGVLIVVERSDGRPAEDCLNRDITHLIGKSLKVFDGLKNPEVNDFRTRMRSLAEESMLKRSGNTPLERLRYQCPLRLADLPEIPTTLKGHLNDQKFVLLTKVMEITSYTSNVHASLTPQQHIEMVLRKLNNSMNIRSEHPHNYVLKVCGREEYLFGDYPLIQFLYIQEVLTVDGVPEVMTVSIDKLRLSLDREVPYMPERRRQTSEHSNTIRRKKNESSWNIQKNYTCIVQSACGLNVDPSRVVEVVCLGGIFHGGKPLCEVQKTKIAVISQEGVATWDEELAFPIKVNNVPRMARLCFGIYELSKYIKVKSKWRGKDKEPVNRLTWANTMVFDYKEQLCTSRERLAMWTHVADDTQGDDMVLHPLGTVVPNPTPDSAVLQVVMSNYDCQYPILFPKQETVMAYSDHIESVSPDLMDRLCRDFERLRTIAEKDPMYEMHEQEKKDIWASRERFRVETPELLPKLLSCVEWGERTQASSVPRMLGEWPLLRVESALELLDYAYADAPVRSFAVKCLERISDNDLMLYLLQLVQALKHESYLMCDLSVFLLQRAFKNMTIGHYLFWHLRSEMHVPSVSVRFRLMLEAYCRGAQEHIKILKQQITCLEKLKWVNKCIKEKKDIAKARSAIKQHLQEKHCVDALCEGFVSPLNPSFKCKRIKPEGCKVMDSKMRPLLLAFENFDPTGKDIRIILKIGDDLRQDMFTLQMLRIMDRLWKNHGYDFRLNAYNCISMEYSVGMIEVVENAETVANIQKTYAPFNAASTINKTALLQWIRKHTENNNDNAFNKAVYEFTMSCAGYCVATYVLGIADRHPDNIMVKKSGQLFHIDFGHFLGHFKQKYGFRRERVPFVLTHDFIHVINKGQKGSSDNNAIDFKIFKEHCETAFKILRKHGHLILSLFSMMISTGLPELSSEKDLQYLRDTLVMDRSEEKAMEHFREKFSDALKNSWKTSFNWVFHNCDKNN